MVIIRNTLLLLFLFFSSCIPVLDPERCEGSLELIAGANPEFAITPLKESYTVGEKIRFFLSFDNESSLFENRTSSYLVFENTNDTSALISTEFVNSPDLNNLLSENKIKITTGKVIFGNTEEQRDFELTFDNNLNKYILDLEVTLTQTRSYELNNFSYSVILGDRKACEFYELVNGIDEITPITFVVQ